MLSWQALRRASATVGITFAALGRARFAPPALADGVRAFSRLCAELCKQHDFQIEVEGTPPAGAHVLVTNHLSYLDPIVLCAVQPLAPIAKAEVDGWPLVGACGRAHGVTFVQRDSVHSRALALRSALRALAAGVPVLNFPEGTTTDGGPLLPFHRGIFGVAGIAGVPVVPASLRFAPSEAHWVGDQLFLPHYLRTAARASTRAIIRYGRPLDARGVPAEVVAAAARARIGELLGQTPRMRRVA